MTNRYERDRDQMWTPSDEFLDKLIEELDKPETPERKARRERTEQLVENGLLTLSNEDFDKFIETCRAGKEPNQALKEALEFTKQSGIE